MRKILAVCSALVLITALLVSACSSGTTTSSSAPPKSTTTASPGTSTAATSAPATTKPTTSTTSQPTTTTSPTAKQPVKGGTLKIIQTTSPKVLGYYPKMGPSDTSGVQPAYETLMTYTTNRSMEPQLAEQWIEDPAKLTITVKVRQGVKFSDGSDLNADVVVWAYNLYISTKVLQDAAKVVSITAVDQYTVLIKLTEWNNSLTLNLGWVPIFSKQAFEANGADYMNTHIIATGPFVLQEFKQDAYSIWVRNENYWGKAQGLPYLDRVEINYIPDPMTASNILQAGQADFWVNPNMQQLIALTKKGLLEQHSWASMDWSIMPNTKSDNSIWKNQKLREAIEYALDRPAIAKTIGLGFYSPLMTLASQDEWGYDPNYAGRAYNPAKAKQLLADAGYPNGLQTKLLLSQGQEDPATAIKSYLDAVGIRVDLDVADPGRFNGAVFTSGWNDLAWMFSGTGMNTLTGATAWWSPYPKSNLQSFGYRESLRTLFDQARQEQTMDGQKAAMGKIWALMADQAMVVPVYHIPTYIVAQPYVHFNYPAHGLSKWPLSTAWMDKK
jgi:peptide/nickel transport system substrate-binding protein